MEFAAICLRNALLLLPEHQQQDIKTESGSKNSSHSGSTESGSENSDACRSRTRSMQHMKYTLIINKHRFTNFMHNYVSILQSTTFSLILSTLYLFLASQCWVDNFQVDCTKKGKADCQPASSSLLEYDSILASQKKTIQYCNKYPNLFLRYYHQILILSHPTKSDSFNTKYNHGI